MVESAPQPHRGRISDADREAAKEKVAEAFALCGLVEGANFVCPACGKVHKSKGTMKVRPSSGWYCYSAGEGGDSIGLVQDYMGLTFPKAVNLLLGRDTQSDGAPKPVKKVKLPELDPVQATSVVDPEVYGMLLHGCGEAGRQAAADYYGQWCIDPRAVHESGAAVVRDVPRMQEGMIQKFGLERLKGCGLITETRTGKDFWLVNAEYPVIEPHLTPKGFVVGLQFRPSPQQLERVKAHQRWAAAKEQGDTSVPKAKYVPKFLSLAGVNPEESLVGCGLYRLARLPAGSTVMIVEGFKDTLAARSMGKEALGIPGTSSRIPDRVVDLLRSHVVQVALDGDEAGIAGQEKVVARLSEAGVAARAVPMPPGKDVTDILMDRHRSTAA